MDGGGLHLDLCVEMEELEVVLNSITNNGSMQLKYNYLRDYMRLIGGYGVGNVTLEDEYYILKTSFLDGDWRAISN